MGNVAICLFGCGKPDKAARGLAGAGQTLAAGLGGQLQALLVGPDENGLAASLAAAAARLYHLDRPELSAYQPEICLRALEESFRRLQPEVILFGNDTYSQELAPRLAHRLGGSSLSDAVELQPAGGLLRVRRPAYGGKATAIFALRRAPAVVSIRARSFAPATPAAAPAPIERLEVELPADAPVRIIERHVEAREGIPLEEAPVIVAGGRGLGGPEGFEELKKLAEVMGAAVGSSRVACDEGWAPPSWQIGQTGKKVAPELYLAVAISGAAQHLLGMADSKVIAAINTDPDAPIFKHASFGIVEDYRRVVPLLARKLAEMRK